MERIFNLLDKIKNKSGAYIGGKNLYDLAMYIGGYECALRDLTGEIALFNAPFQLYMELELGIEYCGGKHWDGIIVEKYGQEEAFDQFYVYLDDFKKLYFNTNEQSLYEILNTKYSKMIEKYFNSLFN